MIGSRWREAQTGFRKGFVESRYASARDLMQTARYYIIGESLYDCTSNRTQSKATSQAL